ncbi:MAG: hypothetical protein U0232_31745 [Thermomicrobiales bacterium]
MSVRLPPNFTPVGLLPPGDYELTLDELRQSLLVVGHPSRGRRWNAAGRLQLVDSLAIMAGRLWQVGITEIFIDGSFVEDKASPNDIDGYFHCSLQLFRSGQLEQQLRQLGSVYE